MDDLGSSALRDARDYGYQREKVQLERRRAEERERWWHRTYGRFMAGEDT